MQIHFLTIFPEMFSSYFSTAMMKRADKAGAVDFAVHNIRDYSDDTHHNVDDTPYGGGAGMVLQVAPIHRAVQAVIAQTPRDRATTRRIILLSAKGQRYTQRDATRLADYDELIFICGRYEGVDERVAVHIADEEISLGDFVLTGGELPAMVIADSVVRLLPSVLGNPQSLLHESHHIDGYKTYPQYTTPASYQGWDVPEVLLSGDHAKIDAWRRAQNTQ